MSAPAATGRGPDPAGLLKMSRGFSCLFWSLPVFSAAQGLALTSGLPPRWQLALLLAPFALLGGGLWMLRAGRVSAPGWPAKLAQATGWAVVAAGLSPFRIWWSQTPLHPYFAVNAAVHYAAMLGLLAGLNRLAGEAARGMDDVPLRREAKAGFGMVLWLGGCTVGALAWLFHRSGLFAEGWPAVLSHLARLPDEARYLFLLPYAMTAYVMWRAKETGFRRAVAGAA